MKFRKQNQLPSKGTLETKVAVLKQRPGLSLVFKGLSMYVQRGKGIGIVGRYATFLHTSYVLNQPLLSTVQVPESHL